MKSFVHSREYFKEFFEYNDILINQTIEVMKNYLIKFYLSPKNQMTIEDDKRNCGFWPKLFICSNMTCLNEIYNVISYLY